MVSESRQLAGESLPSGVEDDLIHHNGSTWATLSSKSLVPIGTILPFCKDLTGVPSMPDTFVECNGQTLSDSDSPLNGQTIPDLNGGNRYLKGNSTSGSTGGNLTHSHSISGGATIGGDGNDNWGTGTNAVNHEPPYYTVVWIMRVK